MAYRGARVGPPFPFETDRRFAQRGDFGGYPRSPPRYERSPVQGRMRPPEPYNYGRPMDNRFDFNNPNNSRNYEAPLPREDFVKGGGPVGRFQEELYERRRREPEYDRGAFERYENVRFYEPERPRRPLPATERGGGNGFPPHHGFKEHDSRRVREYVFLKKGCIKRIGLIMGIY